MMFEIRQRNNPLFFLLFVVIVLANFALIGGLMWVAWHFISKWW